MEDEDSNTSNVPEPALPARLRAELADLYAPRVRVPAQMDAVILSRAKAGYARRARFRRAARWTSAVAGLAAAVALAFIVRSALVRPPATFARGDVNHDGKINILDAYIVAKRLASGGTPDPAWDVNGDGVVDQKDVDWIAQAAVRMNGPVASTRLVARAARPRLAVRGKLPTDSPDITGRSNSGADIPVCREFDFGEPRQTASGGIFIPQADSNRSGRQECRPLTIRWQTGMSTPPARILLAVFLAGAIGADEAGAPAANAAVPARVTFVPVHVWIDPHGKPLACYQIEVAAMAGDATLVGIEGGGHHAYQDPPWYDKRALMGKRIILAAFNTGNNLPGGNTRVATLMFRVAGAVAPRYAATLEVAASTDAKPIDASVTLIPQAAPPRPAAGNARLEGATR